MPTLIAALLITAFTAFSSGLSLIVTFVPGVILAYVLYLLTFRRHLPAPEVVLPLYLLALGVQFLHFAEEHATGFEVVFPALFGAAPYEHDTFVTFNMIAYAMFMMGGLSLYWKIRLLTFVALFFVAYGVIGNAVAHAVFAVASKGYFSGLYTSLVYWLIGPPLLHRIWVKSRTSEAA